MRNKGLTALIAFALLLSTMNNASPAAKVVPGKTCSKAGKTVIQAGKKYTCYRSGRVLKWNRGVTVPLKASPTAKPKVKASAKPSKKPSPKPTPLPSASPAPVITQTPLATPTPTLTPSPTPTPSTTPSATPTPTPSPTPTEEPYYAPPIVIVAPPAPVSTPTPTPSATPSATPTPTPSATPSATPSSAARVAMRIQAPLILRNSDSTPANFYDFSSDSRASDWSIYYGPQLNTYLKHLPAGESFTITWKLTDADSGTILANERVWLLVNGNSAGRQLASFLYLGETSTTSIPTNNNTGNGETQIEGVTDSQGLVSFTLQNLNSGSSADACCTTSFPDPSTLNAFSNISLTTKRAYTNESRDFLWADFVVDTSTSQTTYALLWSDEFNGDTGTAINSSNWTARYCDQSAANGGGACHNNESQYYTPSAVALDGSSQGNAVITTSRINSVPNNAGSCLHNSGSCQFTSARFDTQGKVSFLYGKIEARIKMPAGSGNWAAFWALGDSITSLGWPVSGELDIAEQWRFQTNRNTAAVHYSTGAQGCCANHTYDAGETTNVDYSADYHLYTLTWLPNSVSFSVDGTVFFSKTSSTVRTSLWPFNSPFFLIFNNAVSDQSDSFNPWGGWQSSAMSIDYVRAYSIDGVGSVFTS